MHKSHRHIFFLFLAQILTQCLSDNCLSVIPMLKRCYLLYSLTSFKIIILNVLSIFLNLIIIFTLCNIFSAIKKQVKNHDMYYQRAVHQLLFKFYIFKNCYIYIYIYIYIKSLINHTNFLIFLIN